MHTITNTSQRGGAGAPSYPRPGSPVLGPYNQRAGRLGRALDPGCKQTPALSNSPSGISRRCIKSTVRSPGESARARCRGTVYFGAKLKSLHRPYTIPTPASEAAAKFGYTYGSFRVLCHDFRKGLDREFFLSSGQRGREPNPQRVAETASVRARCRDGVRFSTWRRCRTLDG